MQPHFTGVIAALLTPRLADGSIDLEGLERNIELLLSSGGQGVVTAGGTGEYADLSLQQRKLLFEHAARINGRRGALIASIGAMRLDDAVELAEHALKAGADATLLPPPHFYRYGQADLEDFYRAAAERISGPILIYNLAAFCSPIEPQTALRLIESVDNIIGVKDSSGSPATLELLGAQSDLDCNRILGHDRVLVEAIRRGLLDAVISGPSSVLPEITVGLFQANAAGDSARFEQLAVLFSEALDRLQEFPYPWGLKLLADRRGLFPAQLPFPSGKARQVQLQGLAAWFAGWMPRLDEALA